MGKRRSIAVQGDRLSWERGRGVAERLPCSQHQGPGRPSLTCLVRFSSRLPARAGATAGRDSKMKLWDVVAVCLVLLHTASAFPLPAGKRLLEAPAEDHSLGHRRVPFVLTSDCKNRSLPPGASSADPRAPHSSIHARSHPGPAAKAVRLSTLGLCGKGSEALKGTPLHVADQGSPNAL